MPVSHGGGVSRPFVQPDVFKGDTEPQTPNLGDLWVDLSGATPDLKQCTDLSPLTWTSVGGGGSGLPYRELLLATRTFYVRTDGNDSNDGLANTIGGAFLTVQKAIDEADLLDKSLFNVVINVADGVYAGGWEISDGDVTSSIYTSTISLVGNVVTPANVVIGGDVNMYYCRGLLISGFQFDNDVWAGDGVWTWFDECRFGRGVGGGGSTAYLELSDCVIFGTGSGEGLFGYDGITIFAYRITFEGTLDFPWNVVGAWSNARVTIASAFTGAATGVRYWVDSGAVLDCWGGSETFCPGDKSGKETNGGRYIGTGIRSQTTEMPASEALSAGDLINIWDDAGTLKARKADATTSGKEAMGYVLHSVVIAGDAQVRLEKSTSVVALAGLTIGATYYLSTTPGSITTTPPGGVGNIVQRVGIALSSTELLFDPYEVAATGSGLLHQEVMSRISLRI